MSKNNAPKIVQNEGCYKAILREYFEDEMCINFRFYDNLILGKETYSVITLLDFVAKSYADSCLTLFRRLEDYDFNNMPTQNNNISLRYLPAMFCFRHFIELKLKCLYMEIKKETFSEIHNLSKLLENVKNAGFDSDVFDEPIQYIKKIEKIGDEHFRYLLTKDFRGIDKVEIPMFEFERIKTYIKNIEEQSRNYLDNLMRQHI